MKTRIRREFNRLSILGLDELNVLRVQSEVTEMFERFKEYNEERYEELAEYAIEKAEKDLRKLDIPIILVGLTISEAERTRRAREIVRRVLRAYNPVTQYLYNSEADRKRARLIEAILTAVAAEDVGLLNHIERRNASLWYSQSSEYAISVTDEAYRDTLREAGVRKVQWIAEQDSKTCSECRERHLKVYDIDNVPPKPHYNCRCVLRPYAGSGKT